MFPNCLTDERSPRWFWIQGSSGLIVCSADCKHHDAGGFGHWVMVGTLFTSTWQAKGGSFQKQQEDCRKRHIILRTMDAQRTRRQEDTHTSRTALCLFTFLLKSLRFLYFRIEVSTLYFFQLFYRNLYFMFHILSAIAHANCNEKLYNLAGHTARRQNRASHSVSND